MWRVRWGARPYRNYHRYVMDRAARKDPREAVGGLWETLGQFQLDILKRQGLKSDHHLLDIGCGSLRGGLHFIKYLEPEHYWGLEISAKILQAGERFVEQSGIAKRHPHLLLTNGSDLHRVGRRFDFVLAFGVFTDMPAEPVKALFRSVPQLLNNDGLFIASFGKHPVYSPDPVRMEFRYPWDFFTDLAAETGLEVSMITDQNHPKGHSILAARPVGASTAGT